MLCKIVRGTKVPWERKVLGTKVPQNESSVERLLFPGNEWFEEQKFPGTFVPRERKVSGTKVHDRDYSFLGTKSSCTGAATAC